MHCFKFHFKFPILFPMYFYSTHVTKTFELTIRIIREEKQAVRPIFFVLKAQNKIIYTLVSNHY